MSIGTASAAEVLRAAGLEADALPRIEGDDPVFPTPYRIGAAGAGALGALGVAVARLGELRGLPAQRAAVDVRAAAASLRSTRYFSIDGRPPPPTWDPMSGFYPVRNGWISIHGNFPKHRGAALRVLDSEEDREKAERKSAAWDGVALEDAIHAAGGCAGFVRSAQDWERHPQAAAVASQPLLSIERIGDAPAEPFARAERPLAGVRVLDLTRVLAGPTCAKSLAEHGADVLKITAAHLADLGDNDLDTGIGKRSARLDLREISDREIFEKLIKQGSVFSQSYRPGALAALGFAPEALAKLRPGIVCVSLSAWGGSGPWSARRGFDSIVQAVSGMAQASADAGKPKLLPVSAIDYVSGYLMALGAVAALERRAREGGSWLVRVALARVGRWIVDRGTVAADGGAVELGDAELRALRTEMDAPVGRVSFLKPVIELSHTPPYWALPPVRLGTHPAAWW